MQQSGGLLLADGWTTATQLFSFLQEMKMQASLVTRSGEMQPSPATEVNQLKMDELFLHQRHLSSVRRKLKTEILVTSTEKYGK